jgi:hypothetical protein
MSVKSQLLSIAAGAAAVGAVVVAIGVSGNRSVLVILGGLAVLLAVGAAIGTARWLSPNTRLPEPLRPAATGSDWRRSPTTLELRDGTRITCVVIRPGGYVVPRRTDPPFDTRDAIAVVPATEADWTAERERQALPRR